MTVVTDKTTVKGALCLYEKLNITSNIVGEQGVVTRIFYIILLLTLTGVATTLGAYYWQQHRINGLNTQITVLDTKVSSLQKQQSVSSQQSVTPSSVGMAGTTYVSQKGIQIILYTPVKNTRVTSPLGVVGKVPGNWSTEASFPILLKDSTGKAIAQGAGQLLGDWMTDQPVLFSAKLTYSSTAPGTGALVLQRDNPSGQPSSSDTLSIPVQL